MYLAEHAAEKLSPPFGKMIDKRNIQLLAISNSTIF